jgi:hypothetical protein
MEAAVDVLSQDRLTGVASAVLGRDVQVARWSATDVAYESGSPATGALMQVEGTTADGQPWSAFLKVLQHVRHWPRLHLLPAHLRQGFADSFPWRGELDAWQPGFADRLPAGLRLPALYRVDDLGDDRLAVWMEDVQQAEDGWDLARFRRAAHALGALAARRGDADLLASYGQRTGSGLRAYGAIRVREWAVPMLQEDQVWRHPVLAGAVDAGLRDDLRQLAASTAEVLDLLDRLPQTLPHGDASPQNLLVPVDAPESFVAIDISFQHPHAVGFDLGQLLVGLVHAGVMGADRLPEVHEVLAPAFLESYLSYGATATADDVLQGYVGSLLIRSGLSSLPYELLGAEPSPALAVTFQERAALTRFIVDLAHKHL